jgi:hypothetical protein
MKSSHFLNNIYVGFDFSAGTEKDSTVSKDMDHVKTEEIGWPFERNDLQQELLVNLVRHRLLIVRHRCYQKRSSWTLTSKTPKNNQSHL